MRFRLRPVEILIRYERRTVQGRLEPIDHCQANGRNRRLAEAHLEIGRFRFCPKPDSHDRRNIDRNRVEAGRRARIAQQRMRRLSADAL
jgi:hypothetical protein